MTRLTLFLFSLLTTTTLISQTSISVPAEGCAPMENFDAAQVWSFGGTNSSWNWGNPDKTQITDDITGGGNCIILGANTPAGTYNANEDSWAMSPEYDLTAANNPYLDFDFWHSNENSDTFDEIFIEYSTNNGATWQLLESAISTGVCYDQNWYNFASNWGGNVGGCFPGNGPATWMHVRKCIEPLANESSVYFRFRITSGSTCQNRGAAIDNWMICDQTITANATYTCNGPLSVNFTDASTECPDQWSWDFGDGNTSMVQNPSHTYAACGTYTVTLTSTVTTAAGAGCGPVSDTYTFTIEVLSVSIPNSTNPTCTALSDGTATATVCGNTGGVNYNWTPGMLTGQGSAIISGLSGGTYNVTATPVNQGCPATANVTLVANVNTSIQNVTVCEGTNYTHPDGVIMNIVSDTIHVSTLAAANGCDSIITVNVTMSPAPVVVAGTDQIVCDGTSITLQGSGADTYVWDNGISDAVAFTPTTTTTYTVTGSTTAGCQATDDVTITVEAIPTVSFTADTLSGCAPLLVNFINTSGGTSVNCQWTLNSVQIDVCDTATYLFLDGGTYDATLEVTSPNGCVGTTTYTDYITVETTPQANFTSSVDEVSVFNNEVSFDNSSVNAVTYVWSFGDSTTSVEVSPTHTYNVSNARLYQVQLVAHSQGGCTDTTVMDLFARNETIYYIPNTFTPDGNEYNQTFQPVFTQGFDPYDYNIYIFNRWGEMVWRSNNADIGWDGTYNGRLAESGTYIWKVEYKTSMTDERRTDFGQLHMLR